MNRPSDLRDWLRPSLAFVAVVTAARWMLLAFNQTDLFVDEAQYWLWGQEFAFGYYSKPPLIAWLIGAVTWAAHSDAPFWVRMPGAALQPHAVLGDELGEEAAVDPPRDVVPRRNRQESTGVVVEADGVVEAGRLGGHAAEALHAFRAVVEPPCRAELEAGVVAGQRGQLAGRGRTRLRKRD